MFLARRTMDAMDWSLRSQGSCSANSLPVVEVHLLSCRCYLQLWPFTSYNWLFLWDYTFYKWGFLSTYN